MRSRHVFIIFWIICIVAPGFIYAETSKKQKMGTLTDAQIARIIIEQSIKDYPGNCPCPYNIARNGSRCGKRSAYSRQGGYAPLCYESDVTKDMIKDWRSKNSAQ